MIYGQSATGEPNKFFISTRSHGDDGDYVRDLAAAVFKCGSHNVQDDRLTTLTSHCQRCRANNSHHGTSRQTHNSSQKTCTSSSSCQTYSWGQNGHTDSSDRTGNNVADARRDSFDGILGSGTCQDGFKLLGGFFGFLLSALKFFVVGSRGRMGCISSRHLPFVTWNQMQLVF
jgi:hypothetical protein